MVQIIPTSRPPAVDAADPVLHAVRALVAAAAMPMAVFDAQGDCVVANPAYLLHAAGADGGAAESRVAFSPDGIRDWALATVAEPAGAARLDILDTVANALPVMLSAKDARGRYLFMNRYQADLYGVAPRAAIGRTAAELLGETHGAHTAGIDAEVIRSGRATPFYEESYAGADGQVRHWMTGKVPLRAAAGPVWGVATVAVDITERKRLEQRLRDSRDEAEAGSRARSRFLATMSHELRTPLNAVIGFAEIMKEELFGPLGAPEYAEHAGLILRSGHALLDMITNLLDYARAEAGTLSLNVADVELLRLLRSVAVGVQEDAAMATTAPLPEIDIAPVEGPLAVRGDEQRLRQLLRALIGNAVKFTPSGGRVTVRAAALPGGGAELVVADSGIGMSPGELEQAFEPFWQADSRLGRTRDGAGIGLNLARQLAALHGGTLTLESLKGQGTRVTLRLPAAPPPPAAT